MYSIVDLLDACFCRYFEFFDSLLHEIHVDLSNQMSLSMWMMWSMVIVVGVMGVKQSFGRCQVSTEDIEGNSTPYHSVDEFQSENVCLIPE